MYNTCPQTCHVNNLLIFCPDFRHLVASFPFVFAFTLCPRNHNLYMFPTSSLQCLNLSLHCLVVHLLISAHDDIKENPFHLLPGETVLRAVLWSCGLFCCKHRESKRERLLTLLSINWSDSECRDRVIVGGKITSEVNF